MRSTAASTKRFLRECTTRIATSRTGAESRDRCFRGEVDVRLDLGGAPFFVFASRTLSEATPDGTCGAPTVDEVTLGCVSEEFQ